MRILWLALTVGLLPLGRSNAQNSQHAWGLGIHPGLYSYDAIRKGGSFFDSQRYGAGVELSLHRYLSKSFDAGLETGFGRVRHALDPDTSVRQRDNFFTVNVTGRFKFDNGKILKEDFIFAPFIKLGLGVNTFGDFKRWSMFIPVGLGVNIRIPKSPVALVIQTSFNAGIDNNHFMHHSLGLQVAFGKKAGSKKKQSNEPIDVVQGATDRDYDGVPDEEDRCPDIHGSKLAYGCPDTDGDGVPDTEDRCPEEKGFANLLGCIDSDYDGIIDPDDKCPNEYGETADGCPNTYDPNDRDGDGVPNDSDKCPDQAGLFVAGGCPDRDGDGIPDSEDLCPDYYGVAQHQGCPIDKKELERLKELYGTPDDPNYTLDANGNRVDRNGNRVDRFNNILTDNGYKTDKANKSITSNNGKTTILVDERGNLKSPDGTQYTTAGGYNIDANGNLVDRLGGRLRMDANGILYETTGTAINGKGSKNPVFGGGNITVGGDPNMWTGGNADPSGKGGGIRIGNPESEKYRGLITGFTPPKKLTPEEEEYCQRIDLTELRNAIYFNVNDAGIGSEGTRSLGKVVEAMRRCAILELQIAGHADADGPENYNIQLSERRAQAVLRYIVGQGIDARRLKYNAYGEEYPLVPNDNEQNKQINRRAEIRVQRSY